MSSLQKIKTRIETVHSIRKITHAMELVSTSKMRKARDHFNDVNSYFEQVRNIINIYLANTPESEVDNFLLRKNIEKRLIIVVTSDLGLAGSYNSNVIKLARNIINDNDKIIVIGDKGQILVQKYRTNILHHYSWENNASTDLSSMVVEDALELIRQNEIGSISIIYNEFINNLIQQEHCKEIWPLSLKYEHLGENKIKKIIEFEPNQHNVAVSLAQAYLNASMAQAFASGVLSEFAARRTAMESANNNADELIKNLNQDYNRKRQGNITQELNEIVGGANAV
ncbi:ATP synthase F1 subunit gamma [Mycoplasmopsis bovigenitalium]|uniref:ATP synthase F1 subunit gamma n=1 Tax=Mycoplasmopsis bovigenitalium TaxID=2112 RepID=UPI00090AA8AE|nr:ATP synthase F1 subunit gamma [Mycoplasmopsis bovigenitalium]BAW18034.1 ATP synthase F1 subunit gamma [Mycoplasmopsis bovigenitalium]